MYLFDYILGKLRENGEITLKFILVNRKYDTVYGKRVSEEIDLVVDNMRFEDFGLEAFEGIDIEDSSRIGENERLRK